MVTNVYTVIDFNLDFSETINNNKYINFDNTLPVSEK